MPYVNIQNDAPLPPYPVAPGGAGRWELIRDGVDVPGQGLIAQHVTAAGIGDSYTTHLNGTGTAPTVAAGAGAGAGATVGSQAGHDLGGSFVLTTAGVPAAGTLATITFGTPLAAAPAAVIVTCWDNTGAAAVAVGYSVTATAITVLGPATTAAHALLVTYQVIAT